MKVAGTARQPWLQQMGVRQGCPLSPTLFGLFLDGLHDHLHSPTLTAGIQLRSGKWVSSLVYANDLVLLSWLVSGLQLLLDGMDNFCLGLGLVISPAKTEVVVFCGAGTASTWQVGAQVLPQSASFKYLCLICHESAGTMSYVRIAAAGPLCCGCLCPAAGKVQRALVSTILSHDEAFV